MRKISQLLFVAAIVVVGCDDDDEKISVSEADKTFAINAMIANRAEVDLGQLAKDKSATQAVIDFGMHMVAEHTTAMNDLQAIVNTRDISIPTGLDNEHEQLKQRLQGLTGMEFDTVYVNSQVKDHRKAIAMFQDEAANGKDADLKAYAAKNLPHLNEHLSSAIEVQSALMASASKTNPD
jgi:putative membrane protein